MNRAKVKTLCSTINGVLNSKLALASRDKYLHVIDPLIDSNRSILAYMGGTDPARFKAVESAFQLMLAQFNILMETMNFLDMRSINSRDFNLSNFIDECLDSNSLWKETLILGAYDKSPETDFDLISLNILHSLIEKLGEEMKLDSGFTQIIREITFPPEFYQAGVSILSYFREILIQKYPDINVGVSIKQEGSKVTMIVTPPNGKIEIISKALQDYGMVIIGKHDAHFLLDNEIHILALKHKLELASMEIKHTRELMYTERHQYEKRIEQMEQEVRRFHSILANNLNREPSIVALIEVLKSAQTENITVIHKLIDILNKDLTEKDEAEFKQVMSELKDKEPALFGTVCDKIIFGTLTSTAGNYLFNWVNAVCSSLK